MAGYTRNVPVYTEASSSRGFPNGESQWSPSDPGHSPEGLEGDGDWRDDSPDEPDRKRSKTNEGKPKATRGSKACMPCRKLKMRCVGAESGDPCARCVKGGHPDQCVFEPSQRGKRRNHKTEAMQKTVEKMEATLDTVLKSLRTSDPTLLAAAAGMIATNAPPPPRLSPVPAMPLLSAPVTVAPPVISAAAELPTLTAWTHARPSSAPEEPVSAGPSRPPSPRLHSLPENSLNPLGLLAEASLTSRRKKRGGEDELDEHGKHVLGIADPKYFRPGPISILPLRRFVIENRMPPTLLSDRVVTPEEVVELFDMYFRFCSYQNCLLVEDIYTPTTTGARSPFLFTCICAVASRYYTKRPELYAELSKRAFELATDVIIQGYKSIEVIQGFFLLAMWSQPASRYEQDRMWQFTGIALRLATDLNLFRKTSVQLPDSMDEATKANYRKEILNRERTWFYCFVIDRSMATLLGKPPTIQEDDIIRSARSWYLQADSSPFDVGLMAMVEMHRLNGRIMDVLHSSPSNPGGLNMDMNYRTLMRSFMEQISDWSADWVQRAKMAPLRTQAHGAMREAMAKFYFRYYSLVFLGCGLQHAAEAPNPSLDLQTAFSWCMTYATDLVETALYQMFPLNGLTHMNDSLLLMLTYGATFLLKLTKPVFRDLADEAKSVRLVEELAAALETASVTDSAGPALYASFLKELLRSRKTGPTPQAATRTGTPMPEERAAPNGADPPLFNGETTIDPMLSGEPSMSAGMSPQIQAVGQMEGDPFASLWNNFLLPGVGISNEQMALGDSFPMFQDSFAVNHSTPYEFSVQ